MGFVITKDYARIIQTSELNAITGNDTSVRVLVEGSVKAQIYSYLKQKYDLGSTFADMDAFSMSVIYKAGARVYLDATAYSAASLYALKALTLQAGNVYVCTTAITVVEPFNISKWTLLGAQYDLFYASLPTGYTTFDQDKNYLKADKVFWKDYKYTAQRNSVLVDHEQVLQAIDYANVSRGNVFPVDPYNPQAALNMWGVGVSYAVPVETLPTNTTYWTAGDARDQQFVQIFMDMVVYELCKRIAPNNVPEVRHNAWVSAIKRLKDFANGDLSAELPILQPKKDTPVSHGGTVKQQNNW